MENRRGSRPPVNCGKPLQTRGKNVVRGPTIQSLCAHRRMVRSLYPKKASCVVRTLTTGSKKQRTHASIYWKDTYAAGRLVQKWRKPTNRISQGKLLTKETAATAFHIGIDDVNKCVNETIQLIKDGKHFAILMPISLTSEITRLENVDGQRVHDIETAKKVASMSKIVLASSSETWIVSCPGPTFNHFYNNDMEGMTWLGQSARDLLSFISCDES